ncbi:YciI family protein [Ktedonobacter racemifer]|uniref:YCII-related domain-containing protein n=1 Tax=Ktedonobacter racemifer DSM 44963 TaxID=485913 RepID=D6U8N6_KTERA|nr:YciI family protein [Ktedonobacter racemifer]EFH79596.1 hypothetical protein Krac_0074 [Ktedonobacter racemifer DSM 44963]
MYYKVAVVCHPGPNWNPESPVTKQTMEVFTRFMVKLDREGVLVLAGEWGEGGVIYVLNVPSKEKVEQIMSEDPAIQSGIFRAEAQSFNPLISHSIGDFNNVVIQRSGSF